MSTSYIVQIERFAQRHFIKKFEKKYKGVWDITLRSLEEQFKRFDALFETEIIETICDSKDILICKAEFKIAGTQQSRKTSGNRCIIALSKTEKTIKILLVYHKQDLNGRGNETAQWKKLIKDNYDEYKTIL